VARRNLGRLAAGERFDPAYAADLSDDAVPVVLDGLDGLEPWERQLVLDRACRPQEPGRPVSWNLARAAASAARAEHCPLP